KIIETGTTVASGSKPTSQVVILNREMSTYEPEVYEQQIDMKAETDTRSSKIQDNQKMVKDLKKNKEIEWKEVKKHKGKHAEKSGIIKKPNNEEDNRSIASYNSEDDYQMISAYYDNKEEMEKGNKINVGDNAEQPTYMHRAQIFKRNSEKDLIIIQLDQTVDNLKSRGEFATRIIDLPYGMTARELFPHIAKLKTKTCYFPRTRNNRRKNKVILSFALKEECDNAIEFKWETANFNIQIATERIEKFGAMYKKHNSHYFKIISRQAGEKTYAEVAKNKTKDKVMEILQQIVGRVDLLEQKIKESSPNTRDMDDIISHESNLDSTYIETKNEPIINNIIGISETRCNENKKKWFGDGKDKLRGHWSSNGASAGVTLIFTKEFNNEIFLLLTGKDMIDCYCVVHPENNGYTWKSNNSTEQSRIDTIWMSQEWGNKIKRCELDDLQLVTDSDHKLLRIQIKKAWQNKHTEVMIENRGPRYNMKLMDEGK
ncbi:1115_t:CDS:2, partial [Diversispora eburnea]